MSSGSPAQHDRGRQMQGDSHIARRCVVLVGRGRPFPKELLAALTRRGTEYHVVSNPAGVMVNLAVGPVGAVIVEEPGLIPGIEELLTAIRRYFPRTGCWRFGRCSDGRPTLAKFHDKANGQKIVTHGTPRAPQATACSTPPRNGPPRLCSVENPSSQATDSAVRAGPIACQEPRLAAFPPGPLVTKEELSMLIGPRFGQGGEPEPEEEGIE